MLLASGCQWEVWSVWGRLPHRLIPCPRAWGKLPLPEISHCYSLFDCKCCLSPPAAFQRVRYTAMIDGEQIWETHSSWRDNGEKQLLLFGSAWGILMVYLWSLQTVYMVNDWKVPRQKRKKKKYPTSEQTLAPGAGYQCNNWVWMYSVVVILCEEKQHKTGVLYFFSYDMSSLVIQVFRTVSHSKQKLPKQSLFCFPPEGSIFNRETCYKQTNSVDVHIFLAHCNGIQKNNGGACNLRHAFPLLTGKIRMCRLEGFFHLT